MLGGRSPNPAATGTHTLRLQGKNWENRMFLAHRPGMPARAVETEDDAKNAIWLDLLNPTPDELALAAKLCGQPIPTLDDLSAIESSSRISVRNGAAFLSSPLLRKSGEDFQTMPVGFILTEQRLFTIRFQFYLAFETVAQLVADCVASTMPPPHTTPEHQGEHSQPTEIPPPPATRRHAGAVLVARVE
ncbi:MAG: hypothetical protein ABF436_07345, partial [Acetobacter okinawensis]